VTKGAAPGWKGLINSAIDAAPKEPGEGWSARCKANLASSDTDLWLSTAYIAQQKFGGYKSPQYRAWFKKSVGELKVVDPSLFDAIKTLGFRLATTNYDGLLCSYMGVQPKTWRSAEAVAEILNNETRHVWHIHGYWEDPESVVFSNGDYDRVSASEPAQFLQHTAAFTDTLVFIGCSVDGLADQNVGKLLEWFGRVWGGLAKNHFALVSDDELAAGGWPPIIDRVGYGPKHEDLPSFLHALAAAPHPATGTAPENVNSIELIVPNTPTVGRRDESARVVTAALEGRPCIITGAPGIGKSKIAQAAAYDGQIITRFGKRRVFVSLENRSDPLDILILLADDLGLSPEPTHVNTLAAIRHACGVAPVFAVLDNAEGLIEANDAETRRIVGLLRDTPKLSFVVTSSESLPGLTGWENIPDLQPLNFDDSRTLFCGIATSIQPDDPNLRPLLEALEGHTLSLIIVAGRVDGETVLKPMLERWLDEKAMLLRQPGVPEDRRTSVRAALRFSLTSQHMTPMGKRLLTILGFLPDGLPAGGLKAFLGREDRHYVPKIKRGHRSSATPPADRTSRRWIIKTSQPAPGMRGS
jgi:SIR2-like domain